MSAAPQQHQVELCSMQAQPDGRGFVMDLANARHESMRLAFPGWMLHQLMRALPQLDAVLQQAPRIGGQALIAYPVQAWSVHASPAQEGLALCLRNDRHIDAGFHFTLQDARALHHALGQALAQADVAAASAAPPARFD